MSPASSPLWTSTSPIVRNTRPAKPHRAAPGGNTPGRHSVALWAGALAGSAAGVVIGIFTGPAAIFAGAAVGGMGGAFLARIIDAAPKHRRKDEPYYASPDAFEDFGPAYRFGHETFSRFRGRLFDDVEPELERLWHSCGHDRMLGWGKARNAIRRVWSRSAAALSDDAGTTARSLHN